MGKSDKVKLYQHIYIYSIVICKYVCKNCIYNQYYQPIIAMK